jgi:hypothetical protein
MSQRTYVLSPEQAALAARVQQLGEARLAAAAATTQPSLYRVKIRGPRKHDPVSIATYFKRLRSGNPKARLTAAEKHSAIANHAARVAAAKLVAPQQMVVQGQVDPFIGEILPEFDRAVAHENASQEVRVYLSGVGWFPSPAAYRAYIESK